MCQCVSTCVVQGELYVNNRRVVLRQIPFDLGILYGIEDILRPPGEGGDCDVATTLTAWVNKLLDINYCIISNCCRPTVQYFVLLSVQKGTHQ